MNDVIFAIIVLVILAVIIGLFFGLIVLFTGLGLGLIMAYTGFVSNLPPILAILMFIMFPPTFVAYLIGLAIVHFSQNQQK